jgi:hypothetical protein
MEWKRCRTREAKLKDDVPLTQVHKIGEETRDPLHWVLQRPDFLSNKGPAVIKAIFHPRSSI